MVEPRQQLCDKLKESQDLFKAMQKNYPVRAEGRLNLSEPNRILIDHLDQVQQEFIHIQFDENEPLNPCYQSLLNEGPEDNVFSAKWEGYTSTLLSTIEVLEDLEQEDNRHNRARIRGQLEILIIHSGNLRKAICPNEDKQTDIARDRSA